MWNYYSDQAIIMVVIWEKSTYVGSEIHSSKQLAGCIQLAIHVYSL